MTMETLLNERMTSKEVADRFGVTVSAVGMWRKRGQGPPFFKVGGRVIYKRGDVERWEREQLEPWESSPGGGGE